MNVWGPGGELPLDLALRAHNSSIANTLVQHQADVNACDASGDTLLHRAIKNEDTFAAIFLLDNGADGSIANRFVCRLNYQKFIKFITAKNYR